MAITVTKTVSGLRILNNADKIVCRVDVDVKSVDDSNPSVLTIQSIETIGITTTGITTSTAGFTTYANLTQSEILGWSQVGTALSTSNAVINQAAWIESVKNPPAPAEVNDALPW